MLLLDRKIINEVFTIKEAIESVKKAFMYFSQGKSDVPLRTNIQAPKYGGSFLFMPSYIEDIDAAALKIINIFHNNINNGLPTSPAEILLIDGQTGIVSALLDGTYVTQLRTGAASGAALELLSRKDSRFGAIIGTGGQAATQLEAMISVRNLEKVRVSDLNKDRAIEFAEKMNHQLENYGTKIEAADNANEAVKDADVIITVTPSTKPVFDGKYVKDGATLSCVGSYQPHMQELDPKLLPRISKIYFDSREAVLQEAGDLIIPLQEGTLDENKFIGDLGDLLIEKITGRENDDEIILFETVGIGTQDLVTAKDIYDKAIKLGKGQKWN